MPIPVPASVETRVRKRWSRRAKLTGYAVLVGYLGYVGAMIYVDSGTWIYWIATGLAFGIRYLRAGRLLEENADPSLLDTDTQKLLGTYEEKIRIEGQREVAHGTLSIPTGATDGELSLSREAGALSPAASHDDP